MAKTSAFKMSGFRLSHITVNGYRELQENDRLDIQIKIQISGLGSSDWICTLVCESRFLNVKSGESTEDTPFQFAITAVGFFEAIDETALAEERWQSVIQTQCPALVYTQLRPIMRVLMSEAGFPQFILPTINFASAKQ